MFWLRRLKSREADAAWTLSFADLMSLLMAVFIMIASFSEVRSGHHFDRMRRSMQGAFGFSASAVESGEAETAGRPLSLPERIERMDWASAEGKVEVIDLGESAACELLTEGTRPVIRLAGADAFEAFSGMLKPRAERALRLLAADLAGGTNRLEIRGYAGDGPLPNSAPYRDALDLSYQRAYAAAKVLFACGVGRARVELAACGDHAHPAVTTPGRDGAVTRRIEIVVHATEAAAPEPVIAGKGQSADGR